MGDLPNYSFWVGELEAIVDYAIRRLRAQAELCNELADALARMKVEAQAEAVKYEREQREMQRKIEERLENEAP